MALQDIFQRTMRSVPETLNTFFENVRSIGRGRDLISPIPREQILSPASVMRDTQRRQADQTVQAMQAARSEPPEALPTPTPQPGELPGGTDLAMDYYKQRLPRGQTMQQAFPVTADQNFMSRVAEADKLRKGLANLLLLQAFFESTAGRLTPNIFGAKPGGQSERFKTPVEALEYQLSDKMLGGGANPNMNILQEQRPLTIQDVENLYQVYNPQGDYLSDLVSILQGV